MARINATKSGIETWSSITRRWADFVEQKRNYKPENLVMDLRLVADLLDDLKEFAPEKKEKETA